MLVTVPLLRANIVRFRHRRSKSKAARRRFFFALFFNFARRANKERQNNDDDDEEDKNILTNSVTQQKKYVECVGRAKTIDVYICNKEAHFCSSTKRAQHVYRFLLFPCVVSKNETPRNDNVCTSLDDTFYGLQVHAAVDLNVYRFRSRS